MKNEKELTKKHFPENKEIASRRDLWQLIEELTERVEKTQQALTIAVKRVMELVDEKLLQEELKELEATNEHL